jgi:hypothetical protein
MTSHAYDAFADANCPPLPFDGGKAERDTAVATLRDVLSLCGEELRDAEARFRVGVIVRASLAALGELPDLEADDCPGDEPPF